MTRCLIRIYHFFSQHRLIWVATMLMLFAFFGYYASRIYLEEDIVRLLPSSRNPDGTTKLAFSNLKIKDKTFIVFEDTAGIGTDSLCAVVDALCDSLMATEAQLADGEQTVADLFYRLSAEDLLYEAVDYVEQHLPQFIDTVCYASLDTLLTEANVTRQMAENRELASGMMGQAFPELLQMDPIGMRHVLKDQLLASLSSLTGSYRIVDGHLFVPDSTAAIAILTPVYPGTDSGHNIGLVSRINGICADLHTRCPGVNIGYYGTTVRGAYNSWAIKGDIASNLVGAMSLVLLAICLCFRQWNTALLLLLPVAFGAVFGLAMMYFIKGQFSLLALGIGAIVLGVALSYVLHVITHYKYVGDPVQVLRDQVKPVLMGCITTVGSFLGVIFINTDLLRDFGLFATFAIIATTLFSLIMLPPFFSAERNRVNKRAFALLDKIVTHRFEQHRWLLAFIAIVTCVCVGSFVMDGTQFDADMRNLGYYPEEQQQVEARVRTKTNAGLKSQYFAADGATMEEALQHFAMLEQKLDSLQEAGLVKRYSHTTSLFVPLDVQQQRIDRWKAYWTDERLQEVRTLIERCAPRQGLLPEAFEPFFEAATRTYQAEPLYEAGIIPAGFQSSMMEQCYDGSYLCFANVYCELDSVRSDKTDYHRICQAIADEPHLMVLDTYYYTTDTLRQLGQDFDILQWVSMAFVLVVLLLSFHGNLKHSLLCFLPIVISWIIVLGAMNLFGYRFNLINVIISTFIFGIGVDYSIFIMCGLTQHDAADSQVLRYHRTAILLSALVLFITVGAMLFAVHPAIRSVGFATLIGLSSSVLLAYIVVPFIYRRLRSR